MATKKKTTLKSKSSRTQTKKSTKKNSATKASSKASLAKKKAPAAKKKTTTKKATKKVAKKSVAKKVTDKILPEVIEETKIGEAEVTIDRREKTERRKAVKAVKGDEQKLERREKVSRRRQIDPTTCERDYSDEEVEFMNALEDYKRKNGRMFPTCSEVLEVIRSLGYVKRSQIAPEIMNINPGAAVWGYSSTESEVGTIVQGTPGPMVTENTSGTDSPTACQNAASQGMSELPASTQGQGMMPPINPVYLSPEISFSSTDSSFEEPFSMGDLSSPPDFSAPNFTDDFS